ncbi:helix-turn-helix transcriptional regulator [Planococcus sp. SSTMD024]|uniref:helix-turn-helix transcriptional regulator n=1 Tax=Planococcus TaxID=1372 RepID=UPI00351E6851
MKSEQRVWLKKFRNNKGLTQLEVAKKAGIKRPNYTMIETGQRKPSVATAKSIASALGFDWTIFFEEEGSDSLQKRVAI